MKRILCLVPLLLVILAACVPIRHVAVDAINEVTGSHGVLSFADSGVQINPGATELVRPMLDVLGSNLTIADTACLVEVDLTAARCEWPSLSDATVVIISGQDVSASISFYRPGDPVPKLEHLTN